MAKGKKRSKVSIPKDETKSERFVRVVTPRVNKAVKAIKQIGFCSASNYEYTPKQLEAIFEALAAAQEEIIAKFAGRKEAQEEFTFNE